MGKKKKVMGIVFSATLFVAVCTLLLMGAGPLKSKASYVSNSASASNLIAPTADDSSEYLPGRTDQCVIDTSDIPGTPDSFTYTDVYFFVPASWGAHVNVEPVVPNSEYGYAPTPAIITDDKFVDGGSEIIHYTIAFYGPFDNCRLVFSDGVNKTEVVEAFTFIDNAAYSDSGYMGDFSSHQPLVGTGAFAVYVKSNASSVTAHYTINFDDDYSAELPESTMVLTKNTCYDGYYKGLLIYPVLPIESFNVYFTDESGNKIAPTNTDYLVYDMSIYGDCTFANNKIYNCIPLDVPEEQSVKVYYKSNWDITNIHYKTNDSAWTSAPGVAMADSTYSNFKYIELDAAESSDTIKCCFNNNNDSWDNNSSKDYTLSDSEVYTIVNNKIYKTTPDDILNENITIFYYTGWSTPYMHYKIGNGNWTNAPGVTMSSSEISGYSVISIPMEYEDTLTACFNNGNGYWDSNSGSNYSFSGSGTYTLKNGKISKGIPGSNTVTVYYYSPSEWDSAYIHYKTSSNGWTTAPGVSMQKVNDDDNYYVAKIDLGDSDSLTFCFNDGNNNWDNNNSKDYTILSNGEYLIMNNTISSISPEYFK